MKRPSFQFYPQDWLADPNVISMTAEQRGAYIQLIACMWNTDDCTLPNDDEYLAKLAGVDREAIGGLLHCFRVATKGDKITHKRLEKEREKQDDYKRKCSAAGKKGNDIRWNKGKKKASGSDRVGIAKDRSSSSTTSSTSNLSTKVDKKNTPAQNMKDFIKAVEEDSNKLGVFISAIVTKNRNISPEVVKQEILKFVSYWTELSQSGTKERWEKEKTFEVQRRLATWFVNASKYNKEYGKPTVKFGRDTNNP